ncbi:MAG TPA: class I SAM-dependent methyltransferase [Acidobacteriota bacterium]|nr:class I SAM-dependent methyltransferase [Acidobacteriota bacterium]
MFRQLQEINRRPVPFEQYTAEDLWADEYTSSKMLECHLNGAIDVSSRKTEFIDRSVGWIVTRFALDESTSVADFGCGPGLYTTRLAASGADVTGIDFSERSIRYARDLSQRRGLSVNHIHDNYLDFESNRRFDLITMIMCDFCALSPSQRRIMLDKFFALLKPGGAVLFDVYSLRAFDEREESATYAPNLLNGFWSPEPYFGFLNIFKYDTEKVVLDKYTIVEATRTRVNYNWLQYFGPDTLKREIEGCGLVVEEVLGDVAGAAFDAAAHEFAVVARKPA